MSTFVRTSKRVAVEAPESPAACKRVMFELSPGVEGDEAAVSLDEQIF